MRSAFLALSLLLFCQLAHAQRLHFVFGPNKDTVDNSNNKVVVYLKMKDSSLVRFNHGNKLVVPKTDIANVRSIVVVYDKDTFNYFYDDSYLGTRLIVYKQCIGKECEVSAKRNYDRAANDIKNNASRLHVAIATGMSMNFRYQPTNNGTSTQSSFSYNGFDSRSERPATQHNDVYYVDGE